MPGMRRTGVRTPAPDILDTEVSGFPGKVDADVCLLDLSIRKDNTPADPGCVAPVRSSCRLDLAGHIEVAPLSLAIYRLNDYG